MGNMDSMYREIPKSDKIMVALTCQTDPGKVNRQDPKLLEPIVIGDYVDMLKDFLPINKDADSWVEQILSEDLLARRVWLIQTDKHLQHHFSGKCRIKIVPFGFPFISFKTIAALSSNLTRIPLGRLNSFL